MNAIAHGGVRTPWESLHWKYSGRKYPLPHRGIEPAGISANDWRLGTSSRQLGCEEERKIWTNQSKATKVERKYYSLSLCTLYLPASKVELPWVIQVGCCLPCFFSAINSLWLFILHGRSRRRSVSDYWSVKVGGSETKKKKRKKNSTQTST